MLSVVIINPHSYWHIRILRKIRCAYSGKFFQQRNIIVWSVPKSDKLVIINIKVNPTSFWMFAGFGIVKRNPVNPSEADLYRINFWNLILSNPRKYYLVAIFKIQHFPVTVSHP